MTKPKKPTFRCGSGRHAVRRASAICQHCAREAERRQAMEDIWNENKPRFRGGVVPAVEEIPVLSTGRVLRFPMCLPGQIPLASRKSKKRRRA